MNPLMNPFPIGNLNNPPLNNINTELVRDGFSLGAIPFSSSTIPTGPHTLAPPGNNVQSAAGIFPCAQKGGKINNKKINKISRKYKMKGSKKTIKRRVRKIKKLIRSKYARRMSRRGSRRLRASKRSRSSRHKMKGGAFQPPMTTPNYTAGYSQYLNNNGGLSNTYSLGGPLSAINSALANPPPFQKVDNASTPDNLNHNTLNAYGNIGSGSGFPSRGWF
jgi:hypothetical protein